MIVTLALPLFERVIFCEPLLPTVTFPKLRIVGLAESCGSGADVPVPLREMVVGELEALLVTEMLPVTAPADVGAN